MPLGPARDRDAAAAVALENLQDLLRLRPAQQLLKPRDVFETQFQGLRALVDVARDRLALHPIALLLEIQESAQTGGAWAASRAHVRYHGSNPTLRLRMASRPCRCEGKYRGRREAKKRNTAIMMNMPERSSVVRLCQSSRDSQGRLARSKSPDLLSNRCAGA